MSREKKQKASNLIDAVTRNDIALVRDLISQGVRLDAKNDEGLTALYEAVQCSYEEIALVLIQAGANINAKDRRGKSILMEAIMRRLQRVVRELLLRGVDVHGRSRAGQNALTIASVVGSSELIRELVGVGANIKENNYESLVDAVSFCNAEAIQALLELGANPNAWIDSRGNTLLMIAVEKECVQAVKILLEHQVDVFAINHDNLTAFDLAGELGFRKIAQIIKPYLRT